MATRRDAFGRWAEDVASAYLARAGYVVLTRRFRVPRGEIDVVAREGDTLCFIEIRARRTAEVVHPLATIDRRKQLRIAAAARAYLQQLTDTWPAIRFDAMGLLSPHPGQVGEIMLVRDAFDAHGMRHVCN